MWNSLYQPHLLEIYKGPANNMTLRTKTPHQIIFDKTLARMKMTQYYSLLKRRDNPAQIFRLLTLIRELFSQSLGIVGY